MTDRKVPISPAGISVAPDAAALLAMSSFTDVERDIFQRRYVRTEPIEHTCKDLDISSSTYTNILTSCLRKMRNVRFGGVSVAASEPQPA